MAVTIKQIGELAGVSRGTVDKVLNNRPGVKKETRQKVLSIAQELNYQPNFLGKALVQSQTLVKIGVILTPEHNPFIQDMLLGIQRAQEEFKPFGIEVSVHMPVTLEAAEQLSILNELERDGVSGIALFPIDNDTVKAKVNQMIENGIAVVTCNSKTDGINDLCFVGQDHYKGGRTAAALFLKLFQKGGTIGIIISSYNLSCHTDRLAGFRDRIEESHLDVNIVEVRENQDRKDEAFRTTLEYLNKYPDLDAIYITGGGIGGVGNALKLLNKSKRFRVIGHDLTEDSRELLKEKIVDFIIGQSPEQQGYQIVKVLFEKLVKNITPNKFFEIPIDIIISESLNN
jgi:LacI family transcriptional regulator